MILFTIFFMAAQGLAIFSTAALGAYLTESSSWWSKIIWMILSYVGWVTFTFGLFIVLGADNFIMPFGGSMMAIVPTTIALLLWLAIPLFQERKHG